MKLWKIAPLIISCFFLSGCWDHNEPERLLYANGMGIHYNEKGDVEVFVQIMNLQGLAKQESGGGPGTVKQAEVGRGAGKTMEEAVYNLYHTVDRRIFWGHLSYIIFSEEAVTKGAVKDLADFMDRFRETRYRLYFFVTKDPIKDVMLTTPLDNITLAFAKLSDPSDNYKQSSFIQFINLRELIIHTDEPGHQVHLPLIKLTKQWSNDKARERDLLIEDVVILSENTLLGTIPRKYYRGARAINKNFVRDILLLPVGTDHLFSVTVFDKEVKIYPVTEPDGNVRFDIKMNIKAGLQLSKFNLSKEEIEKAIKRKIKKEIQTTYAYTSKRKIDVFNLSETLYRKDNKAWKKVQKNGLIPLEKDTIKSITINITLQNTGKNNIAPLFKEEHNKGFEKRYK